MEAKRYESDTIINPRNGQLCAWIRFYDTENPGSGKLVDDVCHDLFPEEYILNRGPLRGITSSLAITL